MMIEEHESQQKIVARETKQNKKRACVYCGDDDVIVWHYGDLKQLTLDLARYTMPRGGTPMCPKHNAEVIEQLKANRERTVVRRG